MGFTSGLIAVAIIIVVLSLWGNQLETQLTAGLASSSQAVVNAANAKALAISTTAPGANICNLKITFNPTFDSALYPPGSNQLTINGGGSYQWFNCNKNPPALSILDAWVPQVNNLYYEAGSLTVPKLTFASGGQVLHMYLTVQAPDGTQKSYVTDPTLTQSVTLPNGLFNQAQQYTFTFVIYTIPRQAYTVSVTSDVSINGGAIGTPYIQNVSP